MPIETSAARKPHRPEDIIAQQKEDAARVKGATAPKEPPREFTAATAVVPTRPTGTAVALLDNRTPRQRYLDEIAPSMMAGEAVKFDKTGKFVVVATSEEIKPDAEFIALCDETVVGHIKFNGEGNPPDRVMGPLYGGFVMPSRESLGDLDQTEWPEGLSGKREDPWKHQMMLPLQNSETRELYTFLTSSTTGRRAVGNLLHHYDRMQRTNPGEVPVVRLKSGGFQHKDDRIGWVSTPVFVVVGRIPRDSAVKPDTSVEADMNDQIPF